MVRLSVLLFVLLSFSCKEEDTKDIPDLDFRSEMRQFVQELSIYAKERKSDFLIIPQNGQEILTLNSEANGPLATQYIKAIDAVGREDLFYGYTADDVSTPPVDRDFLIDFCNIAKANNKVVLVTDYCFTQSKMDDSFNQNKGKGFVSFAANQRELDNIPSYPSTIRDLNANDIISIDQAKNFLYLINSSAYTGKKEFLDAIRATNYDLVLIDLFFNEEQLTVADITSLKLKATGGKRLVVCYMSIGEAEDYRYYWKDLDKGLTGSVNPDWPGNYVVNYWEPAWKQIIFGNDQSYTKRIIEAGFDGVYLDIIEAYESFEK
jgi:cysteinyl-tRNA synthetase, unknown class